MVLYITMIKKGLTAIGNVLKGLYLSTTHSQNKELVQIVMKAGECDECVTSNIKFYCDRHKAMYERLFKEVNGELPDWEQW